MKDPIFVLFSTSQTNDIEMCCIIIFLGKMLTYFTFQSISLKHDMTNIICNKILETFSNFPLINMCYVVPKNINDQDYGCIFLS